MREMKDSGIEWIGEIPVDWELQKIKYTLINRTENNDPIVTTDILSLTAKQGVIPLAEKEGGGNKPKENYAAYRLAYPGDIVMNSMNILSGSVGLSKYFGCVSPVYYMLRPLNSSDDVRFFNYIFQTPSFQKSLKGLGNGILIKESGTGKLNTIRMRISIDSLGNQYLPIANSETQKQIADFLDSKCAEIDALTADIQAEIDILEQYKKSIVYNAVRHGIRKSRNLSPVDSDVWNDLPDGWKLVDIKYLFEIVKRVAGKEGYNVLSVTQNGLKIKDITSGDGQLANNYSNYQFVYPTDYVMNHMDLLTGWVDLSSMFGVTSPDYRVFRLRSKEENDCSYFKYVMQCCYMNRIFYSLGQGVSNLGRWRLQTATFNNFKVPVPPIEEQKEISTYLDAKINDINSTIFEKRSQIEILANYKKSLIYEYVTGKKEVPAANTNAVITVDPQAILLGGIVRRIGKSQHGRTQLQKLLYLCNTHLGLNLNIQYYRYEHGPYDVHLNDYIHELVKNQWFNEKKQDKKCVLVSGKKWEEFEQNYPNPFGEKKQEIGKLFKQLKDLSTRQIERIATLYAAWNDFLLDGITPSDDQIIQDVVTNWTENKANFQYSTWQESLNQLKQYGLIPKGTGLHTLPKP